MTDPQPESQQVEIPTLMCDACAEHHAERCDTPIPCGTYFKEMKRVERSMAERAAQLCEREAVEYGISSRACDDAGNIVGGGHDAASSLALKHIAGVIRALSYTPGSEG